MSNTQPEKPERLLHSIKHGSAVTGLCYRTLWRYAKLGKIKTVRCGSSLMIPAAELRRICEKGF